MIGEAAGILLILVHTLCFFMAIYAKDIISIILFYDDLFSPEWWSIIYTFSFWIVHDQIILAWFCINADRTRRIFEDFFLIWLLYLGSLFIPFFIKIPNSQIFQPISILLFILWIFSVRRLMNRGVFFNRPSGKGTFLRDIIYLPLKK